MKPTEQPVILASSPGPPWIEPLFPSRREPRVVFLHGGPYDECTISAYALGQTLVVGGEHGRAVYEHKEHDDDTVTYVAVGEGWVPVDRHEATTAGRPEGRGLSRPAEPEPQPTLAVPALTSDLPDEGALF